MNILKYIFPVFLLLGFNACENNKNIDTQKPVIDITLVDAFPTNCDTLYFGESFDFKVLLTDNIELGSYSISIHNNFDHHSHSTELTECSLDPVKEPIHPFLFIADFEIPSGSIEYATNTSIFIPTSENNILFDEGDYHFFISLTDHEGWSTQKGLSIKILHRTEN
jgi:hypothetical protein